MSEVAYGNCKRLKLFKGFMIQYQIEETAALIVSTERLETMGWNSCGNTYINKMMQNRHELFDYDINTLKLFVNKKKKKRRYKII